MTIFKGSAVALVTPFKNSKVDYEALDRLIEWHIEEGTDAIVTCGTTGEASTLSDIERISITEYAVRKAAGRIPIISGAGTNDTSKSVFLAKELFYAGVNGLLVVTPYYNKATQEGLIKHYNTIADASQVPIIMYSVKSRTGVNINPETVKTLKEHPNIVGIKEASGDISQIVKISRFIDNNFNLYSGNDDHTIPVMSMGGIGCISTVANIIPSDYHKMCALFLEGNYKEASKLQKNMLPIINVCFSEVNPMPIKAAMNMMGLIRREYRMPMCQPTDKTLYMLFNELKSYGIKIHENSLTT